MIRLFSGYHFLLSFYEHAHPPVFSKHGMHHFHVAPEIHVYMLMTFSHQDFLHPGTLLTVLMQVSFQTLCLDGFPGC